MYRDQVGAFERARLLLKSGQNLLFGRELRPRLRQQLHDRAQAQPPLPAWALVGRVDHAWEVGQSSPGHRPRSRPMNTLLGAGLPASTIRYSMQRARPDAWPGCDRNGEGSPPCCKVPEDTWRTEQAALRPSFKKQRSDEAGGIDLAGALVADREPCAVYKAAAFHRLCALGRASRSCSVMPFVQGIHAGAGKYAAHQCQVAAVAAHHLDHEAAALPRPTA